jgi:hypothetical protein
VRSIVLRLNPHPSRETKARRLGHPYRQNQVQNRLQNQLQNRLQIQVEKQNHEKENRQDCPCYPSALTSPWLSSVAIRFLLGARSLRPFVVAVFSGRPARCLNRLPLTSTVDSTTYLVLRLGLRLDPHSRQRRLGRHLQQHPSWSLRQNLCQRPHLFLCPEHSCDFPRLWLLARRFAFGSRGRRLDLGRRT